jgi:putative peptidoglycan lipid II flippase
MIVKNSLIIGFFSVASILLGIVRDRLLAQYIGIGDALDIYNASFRLPDLVLGVTLSFAASATVIPFISKAIAKGDEKDLQERMSSLFIFFGGATTILALLVVIFVPFLTAWLVPGFNLSKQAEFIHFTRILMLQPILLGLSTLISTLAQARHQFYLYGIAPLVYTLGIIFGTVFWYHTYGVGGLIAGVILGSILHLGLQSYTLIKHRVSIKLDSFKWSLIREQLKISVPRSGSFMISQARLLFFASFATTFGIGALSIYLFAQRVFDAVMQILPQSISTASLPTLSGFAGTGDHDAYRKAFKRHSGFIVLSSLAVASVIAVCAPLVVKILYGETGHTKEIANFVAILCISLPLATLNSYISVAFSALKDTKTLFFANMVSTPLAICSAVIFSMRGFGLQSIAYSTIVLSVSYTIIIWYMFSKKRHILFPTQ